jgi:oxygen-dependent protoporphyrinogen oxidase
VTKPVVIAGGGLSGLTAAFYLRRAGVPFRLFEPRERLGGVMLTEHIDGFTVEAGPDSWLTAKPWAAQLLRDAGLADQIIGCREENRKTWIWRDGRLLRYPEGFQLMVPTSVWAILKSPLLSAGAKLKMAAEWFRQPVSRGCEDRPVAEFVADHFGQEAVDYLAEPLLSGIYGGEPALLSAQAVLPKFVELERKYGSVARGVRKEPAKSTGPAFQALRDGFGKLIETLAVPYDRAAVEVVEPGRVRASGQWLEASYIILAGGATPSAHAIHSTDPELADLLRAVKYSSASVVAMGYHRSDVKHPLDGFGFLVPKKERHRMTACTWVSSKWDFRAPADKALFRCFVGDTAPGALEEALAGMKNYMGVTAEPIFTRVFQWPDSMAQYHVGHKQRVERIESRVTRIPGLHLLGNAYHGIGIPDCVREAKRCAEAIAIDRSTRIESAVLRDPDPAP